MLLRNGVVGDASIGADVEVADVDSDSDSEGDGVAVRLVAETTEGGVVSRESTADSLFRIEERRDECGLIIGFILCEHGANSITRDCSSKFSGNQTVNDLNLFHVPSALPRWEQHRVDDEVIRQVAQERR